MIGVLVRLGFAASLALSAVSHAYLYVHGYQRIPAIGTGFLVQASVSLAIALLIVAGGPAWLRWAGAAMAAGSLVASRCRGPWGFSASPNGAGIRRLMRRSAWPPKWSSCCCGGGVAAFGFRGVRPLPFEPALESHRGLFDEEPARRGHG